MLRAVRSGMNIRQAGQQFRFPKSTVAYWVQRTYGERLDRVDLANRKPGRASNRTAFDVEQRIAQLRIDLRESVLGEYGAGAIRTALQAEMARVPSEASVNRASWTAGRCATHPTSRVAQGLVSAERGCGPDRG